MATSQADIRGWLQRAKEEGATHMIVVCDSYDHDDYPVAVLPGQDVRAREAEIGKQEMQRVMEVYRLDLDWEMQLNERRAFHY